MGPVPGRGQAGRRSWGVQDGSVVVRAMVVGAGVARRVRKTDRKGDRRSEEGRDLRDRRTF